MQSPILQYAGPKDKHRGGVLFKWILDLELNVDGHYAFVIETVSSKASEYKDAAGNHPIRLRLGHLLPGGLHNG